MQAWIVISDAEWRVSLREVAAPVPLANEAVISTAAFSINRGEMDLLRRLPERWIPGHDVAGIVLEPAADGSGPPRGARVVGLVHQGAWAQWVAVPVSALAVVPDGIALVQAAALPTAGLCALRTLRLAACAKGARVLVTGAAGGVGSFQVQLAARSGAEVTAVSGRSDADRCLHQLGATKVVRDVSAARGSFDVILESVGGTSLAAAICKIAPGGTIVLSGNSSNTPTPISIFDFIGHEGARMIAFMNYGSDAHTGEDLQSLLGYLERGEVTPPIERTRPWKDIHGALDALRDRRVLGKAILCISEGELSAAP